MTSSIYPLPVEISGNLPLNPNQDILENDIPITAEMVSPGGGGVLRLYFGFELGMFEPTASFGVFNNGTLNGVLNSDNSGNIESDGYYRFDIDVEAGDNINLQMITPLRTLETVNFFRAHLVQVGA